MKIRIVRSARRHRIGDAHILAALIASGEPILVQTALGPQPHYVGEDDRGVQLHLIAIPDDRNPGGMTIIHAMPTGFTDKGRPT